MEKVEKNVAVEYLIEATKKNKAQLLKIWIIGGILVLFVAGYLYWMVTSLQNTILRPEPLAQVIVGQLDTAAPEYFKSARVALKDKAPEAADLVREQIMNLFPVLRSMGEEGIQKVLELIPAFQSELEDAINAHFVSKGDDIKAFYLAHEDSNTAKNVMDDLMAGFVDELYQGYLDSSSKEGGALNVKNSSLQMLRNISIELEQLSNKSPAELTKDERLQRRTIVSWIHALNLHFEEEKVQLSQLQD